MDQISQSYKNKHNIIKWISGNEEIQRQRQPSRHIARLSTERNETTNYARTASSEQNTTSSYPTRIVANPHHTQTQSAKITYEANMLSSRFSGRTRTSSPTISQTQKNDIVDVGTMALEKEFLQKREERVKEVDDIKTLLCEIKIRAGGDGQNVFVTQQHDEQTPEATPRSVRRSNSDIQICSDNSQWTNRREEARTYTNRTRSKSSQPTRRQTKETVETKKESEKRWRKTGAHTARSELKKTAIEKEEIKKRLEKLRQCTRQILNKNIEKQKRPKIEAGDKSLENGTKVKRSTAIKKVTQCKVSARLLPRKKPIEIQSTLPPKDQNVRQNDGKESENAALIITKDSDRSFKTYVESSNLGDDAAPMLTTPVNTNVNIQDTNDANISTTTNHKMNTESSVEQKSNTNAIREELYKPETQQIATNLNNQKQIDSSNAPKPLLEQKQHRIGILRKPETKDHSYSAIKDISFGKENLSCLKPEKLLDPVEWKDFKNQNVVDPPAPDMELKTPVTRLRTSLQQCPPNVNETTATQNNERNELPFWLRPSPVQIYPYNFIMAVRRKLEAIVNPSIPAQNSVKNHQTTSTTDLPEKVEIVATSKKPSPIIDKNQVQDILSADNETEAVDTPLPSTNSNLSKMCSISIQLPNSKTESQLSVLKQLDTANKAYKRQKPADDDDTTISSSIFNSSPEKKNSLKRSEKVHSYKTQRPVSPLSLEGIEQLKITSKSKLNEAIAKKHIEVRRDIQTNDNYMRNTTKFMTQTDFDFNKLLQDFNRSLSQVVEVHEKLKYKINDNPCSNPASTRTATSRNLSTHEYSTNFEESSHEEALLSESRNGTTVATSNKKTEESSKQTYTKTTPSRTPEEKLASKDNSTKSNLIEQVSSTQSSTKSNKNQRSRRNLFQNTDLISTDSTENLTANTDVEEEPIVSPLNLEGLTCSSTYTVASESSKPSAMSNEEQDERLVLIEQLKAQLKETIANAKADRKKTEAAAGLSNSTKHSSSSKRTPDSIINQSQRRRSTESDATNSDTKKSSSATSQTTSKTQKSVLVASAPTTTKSDNMTTTSSMSSILNSPIKSIKNSTTRSKITDRSKASRNSISEQIQYEYEFPSDRSNNDSNRQQQQEQQQQQKKLSTTLPQIATTHINTFRGDFSTQENSSQATLNETQFQSAVQVSSKITNIIADVDVDGVVSSSNSSRISMASITPSNSSQAIANNTTNNNNNDKDAQGDGSTYLKCAKELKGKISPSSAIGTEIVAIFNQSDFELSVMSSNSESSLNYSTVGLYEKLIKNETTKSEHLTALLKIREKVLLDRTKSQIAWLEVQKERYKSRGLMMHIAAIKKKERAILLKMEKERDEIKRLLQNTTTNTTSAARSSGARSSSLTKPNNQTAGKDSEIIQTPVLLSLPTQIIAPNTRATRSSTGNRSAPILRGNYEIESSRSLEELLQKRELDLRVRREHVERLMQWHQRLDQEEAEVQQLENMLLNSNNNNNVLNSTQGRMIVAAHTTTNNNTHKASTFKIVTSKSAKSSPTKSSPVKCKDIAVRTAKMERRLKEIDKSLLELSHISSTASPSAGGDDFSTDTSTVDYVRTTGCKLNKLWRRLTSQQIEKFEPNRRYKLCKSDLERLYEDAKDAVLRDFAQNEERIAIELLEQSGMSSIGSTARSSDIRATVAEPDIDVPSLNLSECAETHEDVGATTTVSTTNSEQEESFTEVSNATNSKRYNYSPSAAEEHFNVQKITDSNTDTESLSTSLRPDHIDRSKLIERNIQKFLALTKLLVAQHSGLQRSQSDTQIADAASVPSLTRLFPHSSQSQRNIATNFAATYTRKSDSSEISSSIDSGDTLSNAESLSSEQAVVQTSNAEESSNTADHFASSQREHSACDISKASTAIADAEASAFISPLSSTYVIGSEEDKRTASNITISTVSHEASPTLPNECVINSKKPRDITTELAQISAAMNELSKANALPTYESTKVDANTTYSSTPDRVNEQNVSADDDNSTYSNNFENISTDIQSPSGCTLKSSSSSSSVSAPSGERIPAAKKQQFETAIQSKTYTKEQLDEGMRKQKQFENYETDFESESQEENETNIDDMSLPHFETTIETTQDDGEASFNVETKSSQIIQFTETKTTILSPPLTPPPPPPPPPPLPTLNGNSSQTANNNVGTTLMPDIINELDLRRCQLFNVEQELLKQQQQQQQQYEQVSAVPYMYVREIPNKPPPPYVPPAPGSPMTTIFPSEERIKDITYRRTHELFCQLSQTDYINAKGEKLPSVMEEKITNIYERIILDICREYLNEHNELLKQGDPINFHSQLAFFNPPDRLRCIQTTVYKEVRRCLAMDKTSPKRTQVYSVYGQRAKRDHIGKIIIQEMYDEDDKWCNFHREEREVLDLMIEEMLSERIQRIVKDVWLEEGGTLPVADNESSTVAAIDELAENQANEESGVSYCETFESTTSATTPHHTVSNNEMKLIADSTTATTTAVT